MLSDGQPPILYPERSWTFAWSSGQREVNLGGEILERAEVKGLEKTETELIASRRAGYRAISARWDLDVAVFFFAVLTSVLTLLFEDVRVECVASAGVVGLFLGWLMGWSKGKQLYGTFYAEEIVKLEEESRKAAEKPFEVTLEEIVRKAILQRWQDWK